MEPKESKMKPKEIKMEPKVTNMEPQGAKREPTKCIQKSPWAPRSILGAKKCDRRRYFGSHFGPFLVQKASKINAKFNIEKNMKFHKKNS